MTTVWRSYETVRIDGDGPIRHLVLNRPEVHNAVNPQLVADVHRACLDLDADPEERVDRAAAKPKVVSDLTRRLDAYLQAIDAGMPRPAATAPPAGGK